ncbi:MULTISPECIES: S8 family serine peptidase [unclassified Kribbella]|uniref:S8 family serine peptidase n=1 Tax=unclassified Kribbella TaxID=2644121 RepID=UPI0030176F70
MPAVALLATAGLIAAGVGVPAHAAPSPAPKAAGAKDIRITLITGDKVTVRGGDPANATIEPGAGRQHVVFNRYRTKKQSYVIPSDVQAAVSDGRLDRRLFDVTGLIENGYDDASTTVIPVLATYQGTAKRSAPAGAKITRQLPSIGAAALSVDKKNATAFLGTATARSANGIGKVWLDGKRKISLDQSVPQIGGPAAWQAGYTGKGVSVAVLDTGIDATHPDLATQVAGERNFTTESADDIVGHGTHVASTIAGTGAASDGKYKGVAPDAKLYDGKVCEEWGCQESAILAGMEWAANEVKARVINLSLGGTDTPEIDPLEDAVNRLTADTGTLFVISAGNSGPEDRTIGSPGSADAALTVGNVDKQDQLNFRSSRGPRVGDGAVKPDVTAPGTDIVAAKSKDSSIGEPVGDRYLRLSGTSMAAPHTAGAAALLLQQHPAWTPGQLKGTLMGSAKVAADQTSFQQGAGRIDVAAAIKQTVIAEPGSVSFGTAAFPHNDDEPVTRDVAFRNLGDQPVTLSLTARLNGPDGSAAPSGALSLSASTLTVPAGGTATVQATSATNHSGADGLYSGRITAVGSGGVSVVVPVGVEKEGEAYTLTISTIRPDGTPSDYPSLVVGLDNDTFQSYGDDSGTVKVRLPKGGYLVDNFQEFELATEDWAFYKLVAPSVKLTSDQHVVLDARKSKVVTTTVPRADASQANSDVGYDRVSPDGKYGFWSAMAGFGFGRIFTLSTGPTLPAAEMTGHVTSQWGVRGDGLFTNTPYLYGIANHQPGEFVTGFQREVRQEDLATVDHAVNATDGQQVEKMIWPVMPYVGGVFARVVHLDLPRTIRYYLDQTPGGWSSDVGVDVPFGDWYLSGTAKPYQAGRSYRERWNTAAFVPSVYRATRDGAELLVSLWSYADADGHVGRVNTSGSSKLYRNGSEVASSGGFGSVSASGLPADEASYTFVTSGTQTVSGFSTRTDLTATFSSAATEVETALPVRTVRYQPDVNDQNTVKRTPVTVLPIVLDGTPGAVLPAVKKLQLQVSGDAGATWKPASVVPSGVGYKAVFPTPAGTTLSLKATVIDAKGNTTDQTVIAAYPLR